MTRGHVMGWIAAPSNPQAPNRPKWAQIALSLASRLKGLIVYKGPLQPDDYSGLLNLAMGNRMLSQTRLRRPDKRTAESILRVGSEAPGFMHRILVCSFGPGSELLIWGLS